MGKGQLIRVELQPGRFVKMHRQHAIEAGLLNAPQKMRTVKTENKMVVPVMNKAEIEEPENQDDFSTIPGVGKATIELLHHQGIFTFAQLRAADLSGLYYRARQAVEDWRSPQEST